MSPELLSQISQISQIIQQSPDVPSGFQALVNGGRTYFLLASTLSFAVGTLLPTALNEYILPLLSRRARTRKYLKFIANSVGAYQEQFPERFNDPDTSWKNWISPVLSRAADVHKINPEDPAWKEVEDKILTKGLEIIAR